MLSSSIVRVVIIVTVVRGIPERDG